jgi:integrase
MAPILLTYNGQPVRGQTVLKQLKWGAQRAGVTVEATSAKHDAPGGQTSRVSPHAMRRAWADIALNEQGVPLDVVAKVLNHKDISTIRRHYARTKPERARAALTAMQL